MNGSLESVLLAADGMSGVTVGSTSSLLTDFWEA